MKRRKYAGKDILSVITAIFTLVLVLSACGNGSNAGTEGQPITFTSVTANGSPSEITTQLTLTFDKAITALSASDISLSGVSGVLKDPLIGSGPVYTMGINFGGGGTSGGKLSVAVAKSGYTISGSPKTVTIYYLPTLSGTVTITGITEIGQNLTANIDSLGGSGTIYYQWKKDGIPISNAENRVYFVPFADSGSTITVTVTRYGNSGSVTSTPVEITAGEATQSTPGLVFTLGYDYNNGTDSYSVSKGMAVANEVVIPAFYNELPVTLIQHQGFSDYTNMTSIKIPASVTSIGSQAFYNCSGLTSITIPDRVTSIGDSAFLGCSGLTSITIPDSVTHISRGMFSGCSGLTSITIPFVGGDPLNVNTNTQFGYIFGSASSNNQNSFIPPSLKTVVITGGTSIGYQAFYNCSGLTSITIPDSVTSIGDWAFLGCSGLTSITIPSSVTQINRNAFGEYASLTSVTFQGTSTLLDGDSFPGDLRYKYYTGGPGTYTRPNDSSEVWTKQ